MTIDIDLDKDKDFNQEFWEWFDSLNKSEKNRFWYYQLDMSKLYFYNKYYVKLRANKSFSHGLLPNEVWVERSASLL